MINNTTDATARVARRQAARCGLDLTIVQRSLDPGEGVGAARRIGCAAALRGMPGLRHILNTDADCIAAPDWVARNLAHLQRADAVCGRIEPISSEAEVLAQMDPVAARNEGIYAALVREFHARHAPHCAHLGGTHGQAAGASLAVTRAAYLAAGGFCAAAVRRGSRPCATAGPDAASDRSRRRRDRAGILPPDRARPGRHVRCVAMARGRRRLPCG